MYFIKTFDLYIIRVSKVRRVIVIINIVLFQFLNINILNILNAI